MNKLKKTLAILFVTALIGSLFVVGLFSYQFGVDAVPTEGIYNDGYGEGLAAQDTEGYSRGYSQDNSFGYSSGYEVGYDIGYVAVRVRI